MVLNFNAKKVAEIEKETRMKFSDILTNFSIGTVVIFLKKGLDIKTDDEAYEAIDAYVKEDEKHDTITLYLDIIEALRDSGFLPKALGVEEMRAKLVEEMSEGVQLV